MKQHIKDLKRLRACTEAVEWAESRDSWQQCWAECERGDWHLWIAGRLAGAPGSETRRPLVLAMCECARLALPHIPEGEQRPRKAIATAESWARDEGVTIEEVQVAVDAANAATATFAADAAYVAADAAYTDDDDATASYTALAAAYATSGAAATAAARTRVLRQCADIVRKHYPTAPDISQEEAR